MKRNETISILKGFAIFSVICAHCNTVAENASSFERICHLILANFASVGVICFFVVSGFLFKCESRRKFFYGKIPLFVSWIFGATVVYLYVALRNPPLSFLNWVNFVIGNGSYFYYLTALCISYLLFAFIPFLQKTAPSLVLMAVTLVFAVWAYKYDLVAPTQYLNFLNWIGYFALGVQIRAHKERLAEFFAVIYKLRPIFYVLYPAAVICRIAFNLGGGYWGVPQVFVIWLGALMLLLLSEDVKRASFRPLKLVAYMGDCSLFIYIWHMPIAGIITKLFSCGPMTALVLLRPFAVLFIVIAACYVLELILRKSDCKAFKTVKMLLGVRTK